MITRLEVDGFKNLVGFAVDFGPFTCIAGPNGVGKSNIFDALGFLAALSNMTMSEAFATIRNSTNVEYKDIFFTDGKRRSQRIKLAAEMIIPSTVTDDFGRTAEPSATFLRYEIEIGEEAPSAKAPLGRLVLISESLDKITEGESAKRLKMPHGASLFRRSVVRNKRRSKAGYISTHDVDGRVEIHVHQEGASRGSPQKAPALSAPRTIVSTTTTSANPTILAARREMQSWRMLSLEPSRLRAPDSFSSEQAIGAHGEHLPATVFRLLENYKKRSGGVEAFLSRIANRMSRFVTSRGIALVRDETRRLLSINLIEENGANIPAHSISDGTLRFLALSTMAEDPDFPGVLCMEEPENGVHPAKLEAVSDVLHELPVNSLEAVGKDNPLRQVIVATHSPGFVQLQNPQDLLLATETRLKTAWGSHASVLRCRPIRGTWRTNALEKGVGETTVLAYLTNQPGSQLQLYFK